LEILFLAICGFLHITFNQKVLSTWLPLAMSLLQYPASRLTSEGENYGYR
jgi:hypothetical protein